MAPERRVLFQGATLWAGGDDPVLGGQDVLVEGEKILQVGKKIPAKGVERIDCAGDVLVPGFQQTHVHACQTLFRGLAEDLPLLPWLQKHIWPLEAAHDPDSLRVSAELTALELLRGGTTAVFSFETVRHSEVVGEVYDRLGLRAVFAPCLVDESAGIPALAVKTSQALADIQILARMYRDHPRVGVGVAPRFALACREETLRESVAMARQAGLPVQTHANEQIAEIELVWERTGRGNIQFLIDCGFHGPMVSLVHGVHLTPRERVQLRESEVSLVHCPSANAKLGSGIAPIVHLRELGVPLSLGADGAPCNNRLDMFAEMRLAGFLQKISQGAGVMSAKSILQMAIGGGRAFLPSGRKTGRIAPGYLADLVLVRQTGWHHCPSTDVLTNLVYSAQPEDVRITMVAGKVLYREGSYPGIDGEEVQRKAREQRARLLARAGR
ncbi:MAG: amidohydrolase family protein [Opitutales bacterium]|nr:amidohydrolase family protein [Opitutales bacterium]